MCTDRTRIESNSSIKPPRFRRMSWSATSSDKGSIFTCSDYVKPPSRTTLKRKSSKIQVTQPSTISPCPLHRWNIQNHFKVNFILNERMFQIPTTSDSFMGYGPVVPDGYGCSYNPHPNSIVFCVSTFRSCESTSSHRFVQQLSANLNQVRQLLEQQSQQATVAWIPLHSSTNVLPVSMSMNVIVNQLLVNYRHTQKRSDPSTDFALCGHKSGPFSSFSLSPNLRYTGRGRRLDLAFLIRRHKAITEAD